MSPRDLLRGRRGRRLLVGGVLLAAGLQLVQPEPPQGELPGDGPIAQHVEIPAHVDRLLRVACYDCHSDQTRWPWYARVSPVSWLVAGDVEHGRSNLDFSRWSTHPVREPTPFQRFRWICRDIREDVMPPKLYLLAHPEARLTVAEEEAICAWSERALQRYEARLSDAR